MSSSTPHYKKGDIVYIEVPYLDKQESQEEETGKDRIALIIIEDSDDDEMIVCPITSKGHRQGRIKIEPSDTFEGKLGTGYNASYVKPMTMFSLRKSHIRRKVASLKAKKLNQVTDALKSSLDRPASTPSVPKSLVRPKTRLR